MTRRAAPAAQRTWTIAADTNDGRVYLRLRDGTHHEWSPKSYLGLRFTEFDARVIADRLTTAYDDGNRWALPPGAIQAEAVDTIAESS